MASCKHVNDTRQPIGLIKVEYGRRHAICTGHPQAELFRAFAAAKRGRLRTARSVFSERSRKVACFLQSSWYTCATQPHLKAPAAAQGTWHVSGTDQRRLCCRVYLQHWGNVHPMLAKQECPAAGTFM